MSFPWSLPIPSKDVAYSELKAWELARENKTGIKVGTYRTDNGELKSKALDKWLRLRGIKQEFTAPYTSAQDEYGELTRWKVRLVFKGFEQIFG